MDSQQFYHFLSLHGYAQNISKKLPCCFGVWSDFWVHPRWYNLDKRSKLHPQRDLKQDLILGSRFEMKSESLLTARGSLTA